MTARGIIIAFVVFLATLVGLFGYREYRNAPADIVPTAQTPAQVLGAAALVADSDGDGLKDWEEELWNTDTLKADTDGDGVSDAEEIKNGRNPLIAGPDDALDPVSAAAKVNPEAKKDIPDTERLARELFATYLASRREGIPLSENEIATMVDTVTASVPQDASPHFTERDINVSDGESTEMLRIYGNALGGAFNKPWPGRENELAVFERAIKDPNEETARLDLATLTPIAFAYQNLSKNFAKISVPVSALALHLRSANALAEIGEAVRGMGLAFDDPVKAFAATARYLDAGERLGESLRGIRALLESQGVSYAVDEDGYALWRVTN